MVLTMGLKGTPSFLDLPESIKLEVLDPCGQHCQHVPSELFSHHWENLKSNSQNLLLRGYGEAM
jgi:hypothetical protein